MIRAGFLLRRLADVPSDDDWLTERELGALAGRPSAKRISDWRLGRWTAKSAIGGFLVHPTPLEVLAADDGAPIALGAGRPLPLAISLSHVAGRALCVLSAPEAALGCDLERVEPRSDEFVSSYFTPAEAAAVARSADRRDLLANLIWSAKESALKALRCGLRADTRSVEVVLGGRSEGWGTLEVIAGKRRFSGRWRRIDDLIATLVSTPPLGEPVDLGSFGAGAQPAGGDSRASRPAASRALPA